MSLDIRKFRNGGYKSFTPDSYSYFLCGEECYEQAVNELGATRVLDILEHGMAFFRANSSFLRMPDVDTTKYTLLWVLDYDSSNRWFLTCEKAHIDNYELSKTELIRYISPTVAEIYDKLMLLPFDTEAQERMWRNYHGTQGISPSVMKSMTPSQYRVMLLDKGIDTFGACNE